MIAEYSPAASWGMAITTLLLIASPFYIAWYHERGERNADREHRRAFRPVEKPVETVGFERPYVRPR